MKQNHGRNMVTLSTGKAGLATQARIDKRSLKVQFLRSCYLQQRRGSGGPSTAHFPTTLSGCPPGADVSMLTWKQVVSAS
jgi:hypothetical protein